MPRFNIKIMRFNIIILNFNPIIANFNIKILRFNIKLPHFNTIFLHFNIKIQRFNTKDGGCYKIHLQLDYNAKFFDSEYQIQFFGLGIIITIVPQIP